MGKGIVHPPSVALTKPTKHFGSPTTEERRAFTRVLQGHIAIDTTVFPQGTSGYILYAYTAIPMSPPHTVEL